MDLKRSDIMADKKPLEQTPLGWEVNMTFLLLQAVDILVEDIDNQLHARRESFKREQKKAFTTYTKKQREASYWLHDVIDVDGAFWEATDMDSKRYSNSVADAHELLRACMLYMDRSHTETGYYKIMRYMRSLPEGGIFPEEFISRFDFNRAWVYEAGDRVRTTNHGEGTLDLHLGNKNWQVKLDNGESVILNENHFHLL